MARSPRRARKPAEVMRGRAAVVATIATLALAALSVWFGPSFPAIPVVARAAAQDGGGLALGVDHVDLLDLHVERLPSGGWRRREVLAPADLADRFARAVAVGARYDRWSLYWDLVERDGAYDWSAVDGIVERDVAAGLRPLAILQGTPPRYATGGTAVSPPGVGGSTRDQAYALGLPGASIQASPPAGLHEPAFLRGGGGTTDDPALASAANPSNPWAAFVAAAAVRYRPGGDLARSRGWPAGSGIRAWEVGNEPNLPHFWSGTATEYARYLEVAYLVMEWADPAATVLHGGIADASGAAAWYDAFLGALTSRAASSPLPTRYGHYFDVAAWHWYAYPRLLATGPAAARSMLARRGLAARPIWVTEMGVPIWSEHPGPCWDPTSPWRAALDEQAAYAWQAYAEAAASGVEALFWFQLYDDCGNGPASYDAFGLVRNHASNQCWTPPSGQACWRFDPSRAGTPRPAFAALNAVHRELAAATLVGRVEEAGGWQRMVFRRPPGDTVTMAWNRNRGDTVVALPARAAAATLLRLAPDGSAPEDTLRAVGGEYRVALPGATNRNNPGDGGAILGGRPVMLIERAAAPTVTPAGPPWRGSALLAVVLDRHRWPRAASPSPTAPSATAAAPHPTPTGTSPAVTVTTPPTGALPTAGPTATPTRPQATATVTSRATDAGQTPTAAPPTPSEAPPTPTGTPAACFLLPVRGPRGDDLQGRGGRWVLRLPEGGDWHVLDAPPGSPICPSRGDASGAEAWAEVPGYVAFGPQRVRAAAAVYVASAPNALANGTFEAGLAGWDAAGGASHVVEGALGGRGAAALGGGAGNGSLSQAVTLPRAGATLSYMWRVEEGGACAGCVVRAWVESPPGAAPVEVPARSEAATGWSHAWHDLSPWDGREVRVIIGAGWPSRLLIDHAAVGRDRPEER